MYLDKQLNHGKPYYILRESLKAPVGYERRLVTKIGESNDLDLAIKERQEKIKILLPSKERTKLENEIELIQLFQLQQFVKNMISEALAFRKTL